MPARKKNKKQINLLPESGFSSTTTGRVVGWLLGTFRMLVIMVEIVVIGAFFSRFWLDGKNEDLSDQITERVSVIKSFSDTEEQLAMVQKQLGIFTEASAQKGVFYKTFDDIRSRTPEEVDLTNIQLSGENVNIEGTSSSPRGVQQILANIEGSEHFEDVAIVEFEPSQENEVLVFFRISASLVI